MIWPSAARRCPLISFKPFDYLVLLLFLEGWLLCFFFFCIFSDAFVGILLIATISLVKINYQKGLITLERWRRHRRKRDTVFFFFQRKDSERLWATLRRSKSAQTLVKILRLHAIEFTSAITSIFGLASHPRDQSLGSFLRPASSLRAHTRLVDSLDSLCLLFSLRLPIPRGWRALPYLGYTGKCRWTGYGLLASLS